MAPVVVLWAVAIMVACSPGDTADADGSAGLLGTDGALPPVDPPPADAQPGQLLEEVARIPPAAVPGARTTAFTYVTTGVEDRTVTATGLLVVPAEPAVGLVVWAHPTRGLADRCAPSLAGPETIPLLDEFLRRRWAVVAPDYEGLGGEGLHPYLVGSSEGRSLLDATVAVHDHVDDLAHLPVVMWGFSQGGHAVAFAAEMAAGAADVDLVAAAVAAPVSDVHSFARRAEQRPDQQGVLLSILAGYAAAYPEVDLSTLLTPEAAELLPTVAEDCIGEVNDAARRLDAVLAGASIDDQPLLTELFAANRAGQRDPRVPLLVVGGTEDDVVWPADTRALAERWCDHGATVSLVERPGEGHAVVVDDLLFDWIADRFAGVPAGRTC